MNKNERMVFFYDMRITATSRAFEIPRPISLRKAFQLMDLVPLEKRTKDIPKDNALLYISDWDWKGDIISILVNKSDRNISDPIFSIPPKGERRTAQKKEGEGQDFSVHIVIHIPNDNATSAIVLVEHCTGLSVFTLLKLFNKILNDAKSLSPDDFEQFHPDGSLGSDNKPKKYKVSFECELVGHMSDDLISDLNNGMIQSIQLITDKRSIKSFDEDEYFEEKYESLVLTTKDKEHPIRDKYNKIVRFFEEKKDKYNRAKIKFKTQEGILRTFDMYTAEGQVQRYVKKEKLDGFENALESSYATFNHEILQKMKDLLVVGE